MANKYLNLTIVLILTICTASIGQVKENPLQDLKSPFQRKKIQHSPRRSGETNSARIKTDEARMPKVVKKDGSILVNLDAFDLDAQDVSKDLKKWLGLSEHSSFSETKRGNGSLQQFYKGFAVEGNVVITHSRNEKVTSLTGRVEEFSEAVTEIKITPSLAKEIAKSHLNVTRLMKDYPVETLFARIPSANGNEVTLAHKVRIDSYSPFEMCYLYIDVNSGKVLKKNKLMAHSDVPGTAQTFYSSTQSITFDSFSDHFRLRETGRKIETYNGTNATDLDANGFVGATDFTSATTSWGGVVQLKSFEITSIEESWWHATLADETPDLFIKIKDAANQTVYTSSYFNNTLPPLTFDNLEILLTNPPYTVEIWDYDVVEENDFGGSFQMSTDVGMPSWSINGNVGNYTVEMSGHIALDVHWGMEKSYDFYLNVFGRNSYDGKGSVIRQYINPPTLQSQFGFSPNNASAFAAPYNIMQYGMGDGVNMNAVVGLDVEGHEFTHMVVEHNGHGGLVYEGESGALNESFSDIFGTCIEFYSGFQPDWTIGENIMIGAPYMRSMSDPKSAHDPDTYNGEYWTNPTNLENDDGGVHTNSGVQNYWFYLLSEGGSGTNDVDNTYSVTGIGIEKARQIAYRNLITYLTPNATYQDAYQGSLLAAEDLFGNPSTEYSEVRRAWYAVGLGNDPDNHCSGTTNLIAKAGTITDGSGAAEYSNNANCKWVISPAGATQIALTFTDFDTEQEYDTVFVYDGPDDTYPLIATWWGNTLPPPLNTTAGNGAMCIKFKTDMNTTANGWEADYTAFTSTVYCAGGTVLSLPTDSFSDGSSANNYGNNQKCYWFIAPPCASTVTLSFSEFSTEQDYDGLVIYDDLQGSNQLALLTGETLPNSVTSTTGQMLVVFLSDFSATLQGFSASYSSTGAANCSGVNTINTTDSGTISDGSGENDYCSNINCQWLIQPPQATSVTLTFSEFDLEAPSIDGKSVYDFVEVYDGSTTSAPLLGSFAGNALPPAITSTGGTMLVRFSSDIAEVKQGWTAAFTSTQNLACSGTTTSLNNQSGTFTDGSGQTLYANNSSCSWLIQPENAHSITVSFTEFDTEADHDGLIIYDGIDNEAPVLAVLSGAALPEPITSTGGSMYIEFISDPSVRSTGWIANFTSTLITGINADTPGEIIDIFPNPTSGELTINSPKAIEIELLDVMGKNIVQSHIINAGENIINIGDLPKGIYVIKYIDQGLQVYSRLIHQ